MENVGSVNTPKFAAARGRVLSLTPAMRWDLTRFAGTYHKSSLPWGKTVRPPQSRGIFEATRLRYHSVTRCSCSNTEKRRTNTRKTTHANDRHRRKYLFVVVVNPRAQNDGASLCKAKCQACHGADGTGDTTASRKLGVKDFHSSKVAKMSDPELFDISKTGKDQMPGYDNNVTDDQIKGVIKEQPALMRFFELP